MSFPADEPSQDWSTFPRAWRADVESQLEAGEALLAWISPDLDNQLHYQESLLVLTDRRLLSGEPESRHASASSDERGSRRWTSWTLSPGLELRERDRAGIGILELIGPSERLSFWRYTNARVIDVRHLIVRFEAFRRDGRVASETDEAEVPCCPECGKALRPGQSVCLSCAPEESTRKTHALLRLLRYARPHLGMAILGISLALASTVAGLVPPLLTMPLLDDILIPYQNGEPVSFSLVPVYLVGLVFAAVLAWLFSWGRSYVLAWVSERMVADLRSEAYGHLQKLSLEFFGGKRTGDLMSRLGPDSERLCTYLADNLVDFGADVLMIGGTAVVLISIDPMLALATLVPFPIIAMLVYHVRARMRRGFQRSNRAWAEMTSVLADTIPGIRVVKAFAQEKREVERYHRANTHVLHSNDRVNTTWTYFWPLVAFLTQLGLLVVWAGGAWRLHEHRITIGVLQAFLAYIGRFYTRLEAMSRMVQMTQRAETSAQRIFELLDRVPTVPEPIQPVPLTKVRGEIEFRSVGFRHGNRLILDQIDLTIAPGEMIGLVGASGAGKSTLVNLVCRFYDVSDGAILVDGVDVRSFAVADYRRNIGLVLQEPFLFFGTVAENIAYGKPDASRDEIIAAARAARAHEFILRLTDGYDSFVGERGQSLSGGERQRISIARALLIDPRILILDEATSSVDTETEREIQEALDNLIQGRTTIAIAHRLSTLRRASRLVVLEKGRIVEVGQQTDLLKTSGAYSRLHRAQAELAMGTAH